MRTSPPLAPHDDDQDTYFVLDDFGERLGLAWRGALPSKTNLESVISDLLDGRYLSPVRIVGFNTAEGWSRDASEDVAKELRARCDMERRDLPDCARDFVEWFEDRKRQRSGPQTR